MSKSKTKSSKRILSWAMRASVFIVLIVLFWSCGTVPGLKEEKIETFIKVPFVRVLLQDNVKEVTITADGSFAIECLKFGEQTVFYSSQPVRIENGYENLRVINKSGDRIAEELTEVNIIPRGSNNRVRVGDRRYRGLMKIRPRGQNVQLINIIHMEDYLKGVVPPEIGPRKDSEFAAVKAQAVAARTYAMAHLQQYETEPYDVKSSIIDQVYEGVNAEIESVNKAIALTSGRVLMYQDKMIDAYYHSTCGGMTDDIVDVWGKKEVPYLKPVSDSACRWSKYFNWTETFTADQLRLRLEQYLVRERGRDVNVAPIKNIVIIGRTAGGRVDRMKVITQDDSFSFYKDRIRWVVGRSSNPDLILPSANFQVEVSHDQNGYARKIIFSGAGYGHGVGMCQCGAIGLAREGWKYGDILTHFYTGVEIRQLY